METSFPFTQTHRYTHTTHTHTLAYTYASPHKRVNLLKPKAVFNFDGRHGMGVSLSTRNDSVKRGTLHRTPRGSLGCSCLTERLPPQDQITAACGMLSALNAGWLWGVHVLGPSCVRMPYCLTQAGWQWHWGAKSLPRKTPGVSGSGRVSQKRSALSLLVSLELAGNRLTFTPSSAFQIGCSLSGR